MRGHMNSGWSAATQVKAVSPDIRIHAVGQGLVCPEASIDSGVIQRACIDLPGSQAAAGHLTDCIGTWDSRIACMPQQAEEARRGFEGTAVGPAHSRGVAGVMPCGAFSLLEAHISGGAAVCNWPLQPCAGSSGNGSLEGAGSQSPRAEEVRSIL